MKPPPPKKLLRLDVARVHEALALAWDSFAKVDANGSVDDARPQRDLHRSAAKCAKEHSSHQLQRQTVRVAVDCKRIHNALASAGLLCWRDAANAARGFTLHSLPRNLHGARRENELRVLLLEFPWLQAKLDAADPAAVMADFDYLPGDEELGLVQGAIRLASHAIGPDKNQLASQLVGRLSSETTRQIQQLVASADTWRGAAWLRPLNGNLHPPGTVLLRTLRGHADRVYAVTMSADGRRAVSGADGLALKVWDLESGRELRTIEDHSGGVNAVAMSADGQRAVSGLEDQTIRGWDVESGRELRMLRGHAGRVHAVAMSADGRRAVSAGDEILLAWDLKSGLCLTSFSGEDTMLCCAIAADGRTIAAGEMSGRIHFLRLVLPEDPI